jgi:fatty acid desaturase
LLIDTGKRVQAEPKNFDGDDQKEKTKMLWTILVVLLVLWLIGAIGGIGGSLIHLLLVVALIVLVINLLTGRRTV